MIKTTTVAQMVGDFGNPNGNGLALLSLNDVGHLTLQDAQDAFEIFTAALKSGGWTGCNFGDGLYNFRNASYTMKPGTGVNIDRKLVVKWRTFNDPTLRSFTISGVPDDCAHLEDADSGERLSDAGKTAMGTLLTAMYGISLPDAAVVLSGIVLQKK